jgi:outer membrane protein assembly factor BamB
MLCGLALILAGCSGDSWYGGGEEPPLPGERVSVLLLDRELQADPGVADVAISLPPAERNAAWPQIGGDSDHMMGHLALAAEPKPAWSAEIGAGEIGQSQLLARPVIENGRVFAMDAAGSVSAFDTADGELIWRRSAELLGLDEAVFGGGLALAGDQLILTLTSGEVISLDAANGTERWRQALNLPLRSAPTVAEGVVLVLTADNQAYALDATSGQPIWRHAGFFEAAGLLGGPSAAVDGGIAIVPYSSAEVFALRLDNGRPLWSDTLQRPRRTQALAEINDIDGMPVIDGDAVYVGGRGGQIAAIDIRRGIRSWDADVTATGTPWLAGDFIYLLTDRNEVLCLVRQNGRVRWVSRLAQRADPDNSGSPALTWRGPILAGDRLVLTSTAGEAVAMSPYNGKVMNRLYLPAPVDTAPVIADGPIYFVTVDARLLAFR